ncbi:MAG: hypothetical protein GY835_22465, partial [bacterium]|nr:hypothetical protein [bacterium]
MDDDALGRAHFLRGVIHDRARNQTLAKADLSRALTLISPEKSPQYHSATLNSLVIVLSGGSAGDFSAALKLFPSVQELYKGKRGLTAERAKLKWVKGSMSVRAKQRNKGKRLLLSARADFLKLKTPVELAGITADLSLLLYPDHEAIVLMCKDLLQLKIFDENVLAAIEKLYSFAQRTRTERTCSCRLRGAILDFRSLVSGLDLPTLLLNTLELFDGSTIQYLLEDPGPVIKFINKENPCDSDKICLELMNHCDQEIVSNPARGKLLAGIAVRLATATGNPCLKSRAFGLLLSAHRALGRYKFAEKASEIALNIHPECTGCISDISFRLAHLHSEQGLTGIALIEINKVLRIATENLDENEQGKAYFLRGVIHDRAGNRDLAIADLSQALTMISPKDSQEYHSAALNSLTIVLASGGRRDFLHALTIFPRVARLFKGKRGVSAERAKVRWVEGSLSARIHLTGRAINLLSASWNALIRLKLPIEIAAITADLAYLHYPDRRAIRNIGKRVAKLDRFEETLKSAVRRLHDSTRTANPFLEGDQDGKIRAAIVNLRELAAGNAIPAPL